LQKKQLSIEGKKNVVKTGEVELQNFNSICVCVSASVSVLVCLCARAPCVSVAVAVAVCVCVCVCLCLFLCLRVRASLCFSCSHFFAVPLAPSVCIRRGVASLSVCVCVCRVSMPVSVFV
jgi:hypothetical protein